MAAPGHVHIEQNAAANSGPKASSGQSVGNGSNNKLHKGNEQISVEQGLGDGKAQINGSGQNALSGSKSDRKNDNEQHGTVISPKNIKSHSSFFSDNRSPTDASKLIYIEPPVGDLVLGMEEIDSVEKAFGHCLIGYVMGPRSSPYALDNYVKRWDKEVKFTFKENGWIRFQFPNKLVRDRVLNGGPYLIFGKQLFIKELPPCFMFSKEDMVFPSWVQIFGLPADCWTTQALSKIASVVGKPLHTDMLTISKKGATFARVLVELDAQKQRIREYSVILPTGKIILIKFKYEFEPKFCEKCDCLGHYVEMCGIELVRQRRRPPRQTTIHRDHPAGHLDAPGLTVPAELKTGIIPVMSEEIPVTIETKKISYADLLKRQLESDEQAVDTQQRDIMSTPLDREVHSLHYDEQLPLDNVPMENHETHDTLGGQYAGIYVTDDDKSVDDSGMHSTHEEDIDMDTDDLFDDLSYVISQIRKIGRQCPGERGLTRKRKTVKI